MSILHHSPHGKALLRRRPTVDATTGERVLAGWQDNKALEVRKDAIGRRYCVEEVNGKVRRVPCGREGLPELEARRAARDKAALDKARNAVDAYRKGDSTAAEMLAGLQGLTRDQLRGLRETMGLDRKGDSLKQDLADKISRAALATLEVRHLPAMGEQAGLDEPVERVMVKEEGRVGGGEKEDAEDIPVRVDRAKVEKLLKDAAVQYTESGKVDDIASGNISDCVESVVRELNESGDTNAGQRLRAANYAINWSLSTGRVSGSVAMQWRSMPATEKLSVLSKMTADSNDGAVASMAEAFKNEIGSRYPEKTKFTGTDAEGREWLNGVLQKKDEPLTGELAPLDLGGTTPAPGDHIPNVGPAAYESGLVSRTSTPQPGQATRPVDLPPDPRVAMRMRRLEELIARAGGKARTATVKATIERNQAEAKKYREELAELRKKSANEVDKASKDGNNTSVVETKPAGERQVEIPDDLKSAYADLVAAGPEGSRVDMIGSKEVARLEKLGLAKTSTHPQYKRSWVTVVEPKSGTTESSASPDTHASAVTTSRHEAAHAIANALNSAGLRANVWAPEGSSARRVYVSDHKGKIGFIEIGHDGGITTSLDRRKGEIKDLIPKLTIVAEQRQRSPQQSNEAPDDPMGRLEWEANRNRLRGGGDMG